jgi:hypothetical protein
MNTKSNFIHIIVCALAILLASIVAMTIFLVAQNKDLAYKAESESKTEYAIEVKYEEEFDGPKELMHAFDLVYKYYKNGYLCKYQFGEALNIILYEYNKNMRICTDDQIIERIDHPETLVHNCSDSEYGYKRAAKTKAEYDEDNYLWINSRGINPY